MGRRFKEGGGRRVCVGHTYICITRARDTQVTQRMLADGDPG